jgi:hypothetical protein
MRGLIQPKLPIDFMDANRMTRAPNLPSSPGSTPSDFFPFGNVKGQFSGCSPNDADDLLSAVKATLNNFKKPTSVIVFDEWVKRLEQCIKTQTGDIG